MTNKWHIISLKVITIDSHYIAVEYSPNIMRVYGNYLERNHMSFISHVMLPAVSDNEISYDKQMRQSVCVFNLCKARKIGDFNSLSEG